MSVWAVVYGNYSPAEVLAIYDNPEAARAHVESDDDAMLRVVEWRARTSFDADTEEDS